MKRASIIHLWSVKVRENVREFGYKSVSLPDMNLSNVHEDARNSELYEIISNKQ